MIQRIRKEIGINFRIILVELALFNFPKICFIEAVRSPEVRPRPMTRARQALPERLLRQRRPVWR